MTRSDAWYLHQSLIGSCVYYSKKCSFCNMRIHVNEMWMKEDRVACGVVGERTRVRIYLNCGWGKANLSLIDFLTFFRRPNILINYSFKYDNASKIYKDYPQKLAGSRFILIIIWRVGPQELDFLTFLKFHSESCFPCDKWTVLPASGPSLYQKTGSGTGVFLWILRNF